MERSKTAPLFGALVAAALAASARLTGAADESPIVDWGREIFVQHCASCHGGDGRGGGPAAATLRTAPPDLSLISRKHGGELPFSWIVGFIDGERPVAAHGSREMPVWGRIFRWANGDYGARAQIYALVEYVGSIQRR